MVALPPISSFSTLTSAVVDIAEDDSEELRAYIPVAIDNAENRLARELDLDILIYTSTISVANSVATLTKPEGHKLTRSITFVDSAGRTKPLRRRTTDYLEEYWPQATSVASGGPKYYAEPDALTIRVCPAPATSGSVRVRGNRRPSALTSANPTNVFTSTCPDALFYATMMEVAQFQRNDRLYNNFMALYTSNRDSLNVEAIRQRRDDGATSQFEEQNTLVNALTKPVGE